MRTDRAPASRVGIPDRAPTGKAGASRARSVRRIPRAFRSGGTASSSSGSLPVTHGWRAVHDASDPSCSLGRSGSGESVAESLARVRLLEAVMSRITDAGGVLKLEEANGSIDAIADRMVAGIPGANVLDDRVGPFYDTTGLRKWFRMSRQTLDAQARVGDVLCVMSGDGQRLYPSFQFDASGNPLPHLRAVLAALDPDREAPWGDAIWLNAPAEDLDGSTPAEALRTDRADDVVRLARQAGAFRL
jgi:hypothetical protein